MAMKNKSFVISIPYMHPICPISISHARIFILADTIGRYKRKNGFRVYMPIGIHFSGKEILDVYLNIKSCLDDQSILRKNKVCVLFLDYYNVKIQTLKKFNGSLSILEYFTKQHLSDLKKLKTLFDFKKFYTTKDYKYERFVKDIFKSYKKLNLIKYRERGKTFDFNKKPWKEKALLQLDSTKITGYGGRKILINAIKKLDSDWIYERETGIGVKIDNKIINPMFDSQLYTLFESKRFNFRLPIDIFFAEYHLSTWIGTKICFETMMLPKKDRTKSYFLLGLAFSKDGKRMSSSRGTSVLLPQLIESNGPEVTRLAILLIGHPNKNFIWDENILHAAAKVIRNYNCFKKNVKKFSTKSNKLVLRMIKEFNSKIDKNIEEGNFRMACINALILFPRKIKNMKINEGKKELQDFLNYLNYIFLP